MLSATHASPQAGPVRHLGFRAFLVLARMLMPALTLAHPGDLDPHFGSGGKVMTGFGTEQIGSVVALLKGGKILVAGVATEGAPASTTSSWRSTRGGEGCEGEEVTG